MHEPRRAQGQQGVPEFAGTQLLEVRTYIVKDGQGQVEIAGVACVVSAADFSANTVTPAKVRVPLYRGQSSALAVSCDKPGYKKRSITVDAADATRQGRYATRSSASATGLIAAVAVDGFSDNTKNEWTYPLAKILLERPEKP